VEKLFRFRRTPWLYVLVAILVCVSLTLGSLPSIGPSPLPQGGASAIAAAQSGLGEAANATGGEEQPLPTPQPIESPHDGNSTPAEPEPSPQAPGNGTIPIASPSPTPQPSPEGPGNATNPDQEPPPGRLPAEPAKTAALVEPDRETVVKSASGKIAVTIPAGAVSESLRVELTEYSPGFSTGRRIVNLFQLDAYAVKRADAKVSHFDRELQITIVHAPGELGGLDALSLRLYYLDEAANRWVLVPGSRYDPETKTLTASVDHFTYFGEMGEAIISGPGNILAAQVGLHSGAAMYSYPIELPPGFGGFQPKIELSYNSSVVSEMKNKLDVGSWVGMGWTLHMGRINYDVGPDEYSIDFGGGRYRLVKDTTSPTSNTYHTVPETFYRITRSDQTWNVYDRDGVHYQFGATLDSRQYYFNVNADPPQTVYYRWDLNAIQGLHSEQVVTVSYVRDICADSLGHYHVRSAYPEYVRYNNNQVEIKLNSSHDYEQDPIGPLRNDNPAGPWTAWRYPPNVVENRKLDSIEVKVDGNPVRKYHFAYLTQPRYVDQTDWAYYSGNHTLTSITEFGADGLSTLPATTFSYAGKKLRLWSSATCAAWFPPHQGDKPELLWPHLTQISNGYGGAQSFEYTELPAEPVPYDIWTRQVVKTRVVYPGDILSLQYYHYYYNYDAQDIDGSPEYLGHYPQYQCAQSSEYCGFSKVKVKDAAGDYTVHYYYSCGAPYYPTEESEFLKGKEYKTEWFDSLDSLLKKQEYTWNYRFTSPSWVDRLRLNGTWEIVRLATDSEGYVYMTHPAVDRVLKYDGWNNLVGTWGGNGTGNGQFHTPWGIAVYGTGNQTRVYVADRYNNRVQKFDSAGVYQAQWSILQPTEVAVDSSGYVYALDSNGNVKVYDSSGNYQGLAITGLGGGQGLTVDSVGRIYVTVGHYVRKYGPGGYYEWGGFGNETGQFKWPQGITTDSSDNLYIADSGNCRIQEYGPGGAGYLREFGKITCPRDVAARPTTHGPYEEMAVCGNPNTTLAHPYFVYLEKVETTVGSKVSQTRYLYDDYGNVITEYNDGDTSTSSDDSTIHRVFYPNTTDWILNKPARERVYATITDDIGGANLKAETRYYYDGLAWGQPPTKGDLTRLQQFKNASESVSTYHTYDAYGNPLTETDPKGNIMTFTYNSGFPFPISVTYPTVNNITMQEFCSWDYTSGNMLAVTDANGQVTSYEYDAFKRPTKVVKPGDSSASPTIQYQYNNWGTYGQQHLKKLTKLSAGNYAWTSQYFDGVGRVVQTQARGETGYTVIESGTWYNTRGLVGREYVSQELSSGSVNGYYTPAGDWKHASYAYDGLGRVTTQTNPDGTTTGHDYSTAWKDLVTNQRGYKKANYYDAFERLTQVEEYDESQALYSTTTYAYDVLNNLTQVTDNASNTIGITYDWLSRKIAMSDPDMGQWSYAYDNNSNLTTQADARGLFTAFAYDALNRLTVKAYSIGSGTANVFYEYDGPPQGPQNVTIRPNGPGAYTQIASQTPSSGSHWDKVDEVSSDGDSTYVKASSTGTAFTYDTYSLQDPSCSGTINSVTVYVSAKRSGTAYGRCALYIGGTLYYQPTGSYGFTPLTYWSQYGYAWSTNPATGTAWTWSDINNLQAGYGGRAASSYSSMCTQVYVVVNYTPPAPPPPLSFDKGRRTGMTDAAGTTHYKYDTRGRLIQEARTISGANYTTSFGYDSADRLTAITYPTGETVTRTYNGRGFPYSVSGSLAGGVVAAALYNKLGEPTAVVFGNSMCTTFGYWGVGGYYDTTGGYYGRLWEIKTFQSINPVQDVRHTWDAGGNLLSRYDVNASETETFFYDFLDRLTGVSGPYSHAYSYNPIGNTLSMNGSSYTYGAKPHAVTAVGSTAYSYDANGNMISRGGTAITWDVENRPTVIGNATFVYDGDGARVKKTEGGQTTVYVNKYYEKNLSTGAVTTYYYLGDRLVALRNGSSVYYVHEDHLTGTSVVTNSSGTVAGSIRYYPYGSTRSSTGSLYTDKKFTGQRLDATGLYYYGARYYDPTIGRFISADPTAPDPGNPQGLSRYSYAANNPTGYVDPSGLDAVIAGGSGMTEEEMEDRFADLIASLGLGADERVIYLPDIDPERGIDLWDVGPRLHQLMDTLQGLTDIKLVGFSEGAATVGVLLSDLADGRSTLSPSIVGELRAAVMLECPTGLGQQLAIRGYDDRSLYDLPGRLEKARIDIDIADIYNSASVVHGGPLPGWEGRTFSYDSRPWYLKAIDWTPSMGPFSLGFGARVAGTLGSRGYHNQILQSEYAMNVAYGTVHGH